MFYKYEGLGIIDMFNDTYGYPIFREARFQYIATGTSVG